MTIKLQGAPFSIANRREVASDGKVVGLLWANSPKHNWGGGGTSYTFTPNDNGKKLGFSGFIAADSVSKAKEQLKRQEMKL